jgi:putative membrane protein
MYDFLFAWHLDVPVMIGLLVSEGLYLLLVERLWRKTGSYDTRAAWAWSIGLVVVFIALESPLDTIAETRLLASHMLQHELMIAVAPPLLLLGLFPRLVVPITRPIFKPLLRNRFTYKLLQVLFSPYCTLGIWLVFVYIWHVPSLYTLALQFQSLHVVEHLSFVVAGTLFWLPIIEPVPGLTRMRPVAKLVYIALGQLGTIPLVVTLLWSPSLIYSYYAWRSPLWNLSHAEDQQLAAIVMMVIDMLVALTALAWITLQALAVAEWQDKRPRPAQRTPGDSAQAACDIMTSSE